MLEPSDTLADFILALRQADRSPGMSRSTAIVAITLCRRGKWLQAFLALVSGYNSFDRMPLEHFKEILGVIRESLTDEELLLVEEFTHSLDR